MPEDGMVGGVDAKKRGCYSPLQYRWMTRRWNNSEGRRNVIGIIGLPDQTAVIQTFPGEWATKSHIETAVSLQEVAEWIRKFCGM